MAGRWVVLLEAADGGGSGGMDRGDVARLLAALGEKCDGGGGGGALHSSDRYALQVETAASGPVEALLVVLSSWADAVRELDLPRWQVVRAELLTPDELERDLRNQLRDEMALPRAGATSRRRSCRQRGASPPLR